MLLLDPKAFKTYCALSPDGDYALKLQKRKKPRSNSQNAYYWGVVVQTLSEETGHFPDEIHEAMKLKFLRKHCDKLKLDSVRSTTDLSTVEFEEFMAQIRMFAAADLNITIPLPNEVDFAHWG